MPAIRLHEAFNFTVGIHGATSAASLTEAEIYGGFSKVGPVQASFGYSTYLPGGALYPIRDPDTMTWSEVTLETGFLERSIVTDWLMAVRKSFTTGYLPTTAEKLVVIYQNPRAKHKENAKPIRKFMLWNCVPVSYRFGDWDAGSDAVVIASLTLAYQYAQITDNFGVQGEAPPPPRSERA